MQDTRSAIVSILSADSVLTSQLGDGINSIFNERDITPSIKMNYPFIVITFQGARPHTLDTPHISVETWTLRVYDQANGYFRISSIQTRLKKLLHRVDMNLVTDTTSPPDEQTGVLDVNWVWFTPDYYDLGFKSENAGVRFHITLIDHRYTN